MSKEGVAITIRRRVFPMKCTNYSKIIEDSLVIVCNDFFFFARDTAT